MVTHVKLAPIGLRMFMHAFQHLLSKLLDRRRKLIDRSRFRGGAEFFQQDDGRVVDMNGLERKSKIQKSGTLTRQAPTENLRPGDR